MRPTDLFFSKITPLLKEKVLIELSEIEVKHGKIYLMAWRGVVWRGVYLVACANFERLANCQKTELR